MQMKDMFGRHVGPYRVWLKNEQAPGLAMSRSIGDLVAQSAGVIPNPEIIQMPKLNEHIAVVVGSDGVWEFLTNERVCAIVSANASTKDAKKACD